MIIPQARCTYGHNNTFCNICVTKTIGAESPNSFENGQDDSRMHAQLQDNLHHYKIMSPQSFEGYSQTKAMSTL